MSDVKLVKVDNWGIFFLQRLKHFFNRTDYCDLTLQFQDNAQLKVHRLVLSACTEYFELLERTCEMYEDCLVMPDDLQADVVVPIINFMYTGQLEFRMDLLERLYQTSLVMNMPVLTKLLDAHRTQVHREPYTTYSNTKRYAKSYEKNIPSASSSNMASNKRSYGKAFQNDTSFRKYGKQSGDKSAFDVSKDLTSNTMSFNYETTTSKKNIITDPRPTRYELPEELESDSLFDNSFTNISYTSKPLMVHPETTKRYPPKRSGIFEDPSTSKRFAHGQSTMDIVECKKISMSERIFDDDPSENICDDQSSFQQPMSIKDELRDSNQLFDQILDGGPKVTIETKDNKQSNNLDHAKIISEVLKKYPHLVKSNKNIKLKILNTPAKKKPRPLNSFEEEKEKQKNKASAMPEYAYESKVLDSKEAAKLIALGAENIDGPWICLICGAPGKAIHFSSYYKFRRHLVDVHNEKPVLNICEYCGHKSMKRNYLLHHLYTKHGVEPPAHYRFPKCNICNYVALTEGYLLKHKLSHPDRHYRCNTCSATFSASNQLLLHIQKTGHKYSDKKPSLKCIYCFKTFTREGNLYAHLRTNHKESARDDGIIDISDDEKTEIKESKVIMKSPLKQEHIKYEIPVTYENEYEFDADMQYQIQQQPDGNIQVLSKKPRILLPTVKHKILNPGFGTPANKIIQKQVLVNNSNSNKHNEFTESTNNSINTLSEGLVIIDNDEYVVKNNHLIPKKEKMVGREEFSMSDMIQTDIDNTVPNIIPTSTAEYTAEQATSSGHHKMIVNKSNSMNQPIQIVVSNEEEYKALMSSNHSIIFEDGDTNKTLTVLTAPHDSNTIDLDNTQPNDMMIIPEGYPLNVSETVSGNSSNIVVVYSHAVDDQNKEYQLIASENLDAQFVTSTAILTQNYETVTTSAPIMNAHELQTPAEDTWSNSIPENISCNTQMDVPVSGNQVSITPTENEQSTVTNLEEVQLPPVNSTVTVEILPSTDINQNDADLNTQPGNVIETGTNINNLQPDIVDSNDTGYVETVESSNMEGDCINNSTNGNTEEIVETLSNVNSIVPQESNCIEDISVANEANTEEALKQDTLDETKYIENASCGESSEETETIENIAKAIQSTSVINTVSDETEMQMSMVNEPSNINNPPVVKANEQIQSLTSEWSDDDTEITTQDQSTSQESNDIKVRENDAMETDSQSELEESIENIQHEMEKQLSRPEKRLSVPKPEEPPTETENVTTVTQQDPVSVQETEPENNCATQNESSKTPDKISSLLNDWEDNDSQESEAEIKIHPVNENKENTEIINESDTTQHVENPGSSEDTPEPEQTKESDNKKEELTKPSDNIQSLVSDWVEDDEDEETVSK